MAQSNPLKKPAFRYSLDFDFSAYHITPSFKYKLRFTPETHHTKIGVFSYAIPIIAGVKGSILGFLIADNRLFKDLQSSNKDKVLLIGNSFELKNPGLLRVATTGTKEMRDSKYFAGVKALYPQFGGKRMGYRTAPSTQFSRSMETST